MFQDGDNGAIIQRDKQTYAVAPHVPCGVVTPEILRKLADVAEKYHVQAMKITSAARIALVGVTEEEVPAIWTDLGMDPGAAVGICVRSVKACPGTTFCKRGQQDSLAVGMELDRRYHGMEMPGKIKMGVSGCPNQCAENAIKDISLMGTAKGWRLMVGGNGGAVPRLAQTVCDNLSTEEAYEYIEKVLAYYREFHQAKERIGRTVERNGLDHLKRYLGVLPPENVSENSEVS
ncbi:MAG: NAD(P)/FAD-dependent oxidoreductase [Planctomycetia bacterium]|nr:NAD(P)/FAD-dependent oxidoreductase [Planctomycetia bacterium]